MLTIVPLFIDFNLGKRAFSVAASRVWNELSFIPLLLKTQYIYSKFHFHHKSSVVPRSDNDFVHDY